MATIYELESNNLTNSANKFALGDYVIGNLANSSDVDFFVFSPSASGRYSLNFAPSVFVTSVSFLSFSVYYNDTNTLLTSGYTRVTEKNETFGFTVGGTGNVYVKFAELAGNRVNTSEYRFYVSSVNSTPTYSISSSASFVNEGQSAIFTLTTTNVTPGTSINYSLSGVSISDITGGSLSGTTTIGSTGSSVISIPTTLDLTTEGDETLTITVQGISSSVIVKDTSLTPTPTYSVTTASSSVNEGSSTVFTLTTTNIAAGTIVPYTISGVSKDDVVGGSLSGNVTIGSNGQGTVTVQLTFDKTTEGNETLTFTAQGKSVSVVVNDTSTSTKLSAFSKVASGETVEIGKQTPIMQSFDPDWTKMTAGSLEQFNVNGRGNGDNIIRAINVMTILDDPADGRQIDPTRLGFWIEQIEEGTLTLGDKVMRDILSGFVYGKEFSELALKRMDTNGDGINDISYTKAAVQLMYRNVLGRSWADIVNDPGANWLASEIEANRVTIVEVAERVCLGAEAINSAVSIVGTQNLTFVAFGDGFGG